MTDDSKKIENLDNALQRLTTVLEVYGAKPLSWPEEERDFLQKLIRKNIAADQIYQEAVALEHVLDQAAVPKDMASLQSRIMARIGEQAVISEQTVEAEVIDFASRQKPKPAAKVPYLDIVQNIAVMAAALIIGIYIGTTDFVSKLTPFDQSVSSNIVTLVPAPVDKNGLPYEESFL
ncbi:MAG: hypothetical protein ACRBBN_15470 [Methyloligellaceae bacterium]